MIEGSNISNRMLNLLNKHGKRKKSETTGTWLKRRRTLSTACFITDNIDRNIDFSDFKLAISVGSCEPNVRTFISMYESIMGMAYSNEEKFLVELHLFYVRMAKFIKQEQLYREFCDYFHVLSTFQGQKFVEGFHDIFSAYISLLMQQMTYFSDGDEVDIIGVHSDNTPIVQPSAFPYVDMPSYIIQDYAEKHGKFDLSNILSAARKYGYSVDSLDDLLVLESCSRVYESNTFMMAPFINEKCLDIVLKTPYKCNVPVYPREWKSTSIYRERLKKRNYMLPADGITANYRNAGDISSIIFKEILYNNRVILLYRVITFSNGDLSGYYDTKSDIFYSLYEFSKNTVGYSDCFLWHSQLENFILENYVMLSCDFEIDRKRNWAIRQVEDLKTDHFPDQVLVKYTWGKKSQCINNSNQRIFNKDEYVEESKHRPGYMRRLLKGQNVPKEAVEQAAALGYEIPPGFTYVRDHDITTEQRNIFFIRSN